MLEHVACLQITTTTKLGHSVSELLPVLPSLLHRSASFHTSHLRGRIGRDRLAADAPLLTDFSAQPEPGRAAAASSSPARLSAPAAISKDKSTAADSDTAGGDRPRSSLCNSRGCSPKKERFAMPDLHGGGNLDKYESFRFLFLFFCSFKLESAWCGSSGDFALLQPLPEPPS